MAFDQSVDATAYERRNRRVTRQLEDDGWLWDHSVKKQRALWWRLTRFGALVGKRRGHKTDAGEL